jgi:hypothetical protein
VYDYHARTQFAREHAEDLRVAWPANATPLYRVREVLAVVLIRAGAKVAPECAPPWVSSRA